MNSILELWSSFLICFVFAGVGMIVALKRKRIERSRLKNIGIWVLLGFLSFLFLLVIRAGLGTYFSEINFHYLDGALVGLVYSYFMTSAKMFDESN
jgi:hypothetical protein